MEYKIVCHNTIHGVILSGPTIQMVTEVRAPEGFALSQGSGQSVVLPMRIASDVCEAQRRPFSETF